MRGIEPPKPALPRTVAAYRPLPRPAPSAAWCNAATAQEASRDITLSARELRITGTFAPRTSPALSAWATLVATVSRPYAATG